jgi:hypothetical protein
MNKTLLALAPAGVLVTTGAVTANDLRVPEMTRVQYNGGWYDRSATINDREARINDRIERGMRDGRINEREARRLTGELNRIEQKERDFKDDGRLSRRETDELSRDLDRLADHVRQEMRD